MAQKGKLGVVASVKDGWAKVYTAPADVDFVVVSLNILNLNDATANVKVAFTANPSAPSDLDLVDSDTLENRAVLERTCMLLSAGESVSVFANQANVIVRAYGIEEAKTSV